MKGGLNVILHALKTFETIEGAKRVGYDVMINSDEETGSLASRGLIEELAQGKYAALTYEPSALPDGTSPLAYCVFPSPLGPTKTRNL